MRRGRSRSTAASRCSPRRVALLPTATIPAADRWPTEAKAGRLRCRRPGRRSDRPDRPGRARRGPQPLRVGPRRRPQGRHGRARALLTEVAAAGDGARRGASSRRSRACSKAPQGRRRARPSPPTSSPARRTPKPSPPRSSTPRSAPRSPRPAGSRRPIPTRRSPSTSRPSRPSRPPASPEPHPADGPPARGRHRAGQEGQGRLRRQDARQVATAPRSSRSGCGSSRPTRPRRTA